MSVKNVEIQTIGLHVGTPDHSKIFEYQRKYTKSGIFTCAGVSIFGDCSDRGGMATVTIGTADATSTQRNMKLSLNVKGNSVLQGDSQTPNALYVSGGKSPNTVYIKGDLYVSGSTDSGNKGRLASRFAAADASPKPFDLKPPTKGDGHRLRYACIEGPEVGVYYRGRLTGSNRIKLPSYWKDLVHAESITVQLQPIGDRHFHLNIVSFDNKEIIIKEADDKPIDCFFHMYGERKDINPLIVEYEGNSWEDYPDPNYNPNKVDSDKKNTKDPRFDGPPNTITK